jgi:hypothetical protein
MLIDAGEEQVGNLAQEVEPLLLGALLSEAFQLGKHPFGLHGGGAIGDGNRR